MFFFQFFENQDEVINYLFSFVTCLDPINNVLEQILILFAWSHRFNTSRIQTFLEEAGIDATSTTENSTLHWLVGFEKIPEDLIRSDFDYAYKWNGATAGENVFFESMCCVASTDYKITICSYKVLRHGPEGGTTVDTSTMDGVVSIWNLGVELDYCVDVILVKRGTVKLRRPLENAREEVYSCFGTKTT